MKIYLMITDTEDGGHDVQHFLTPEALGIEHQKFVEHYWKQSTAAERGEMPEDLKEAWDVLTAGTGFMEMLYITEIEVAVDQQPLPTLAIVMEGGLCQGVVSDQPERVAQMLDAVIVIDYDTEGCDLDELQWVKQDDGTWSDAIVVSHAISKAAIGLDEFRETNPEDDCRICGADATGGEGHDGMCGSCADKGDSLGAEAAARAAIESWGLTKINDVWKSYGLTEMIDMMAPVWTMRENLIKGIADWVGFCEHNGIQFTSIDPPSPENMQPQGEAS